MLCPECGKRPATLHYTKIVNGNKTEFHLCEVCAQEKGEYMPGFENGFSFHQLLSGLLNFEPSASETGHGSAMKTQITRCPTCGLTYNQFSKIGRFGCSDCYQTFRDRLVPLLRRVHGHSSHRGKIPERTKGELKLRRQLERLKEELAHKVEAEEFEEAAKLRDQIRSLQERLEQ
ncbi:UvrB/UvrC motif-containing protein [Paenactinomyces guangxiensis]|uniref:UvrB/UvrC motif-containing protein n=1 Tax=Paenactinomyces guangxiensis TaxID=1490290 RepID=A0A7W1WTS0_9BACL|nr:UvrB/UvrC motif-containing protein [Paenactinomyces guangxiensis]MBA4495854.1 UvrB/UvrC motif-containing protein [Paenactinomyces guangxiensis]MBH8593009.1 UvrB/UvrC motif-containing protein [Paenactinomyces guangxiensis]